MHLVGDDDLELSVTSVTQGGLQIAEAHEKLTEIHPDVLAKANAFVVHVGSCGFPVNDHSEIKHHFMKYIELLNHVSDKCPKARIFMSSVPPRKGLVNRDINLQIA